MTPPAPLSGTRVVELTGELGELCGRLLADFGADVIRVEPPGGSPSRRLPPFHDDESLYFAYRNSNKRGVTLDLESAADRERFDALLADADVLIESLAPGELARLGVAPTELVARHPHLIATSISAFGQTGPYRDWTATDSVLEAMGGMMFKAGIPEKAPLIPPGNIATDAASVAATFATLTALLQRERSGHGQHIDLSALEAIAQTTDWSVSNASFLLHQGGEYNQTRMGSGPMYAIYACKGGYVRLVILSKRQWRAMREWLGEPEFLQDDNWDTFLARFSIADVLNKLYTEHFASMSMEEVAVEAQRRGIVCTPVLRPDEVLRNEHLLSRDTFIDAEVAPGVRGPVAAGFFEIDGERQGFRTRAPEPGEHNDALASGKNGGGARPRPARSGPAPAPSAPLAGLRVLDFGLGGVGVEAGRLFAEYGADVIKIETRTYPDFIRTIMNTEMNASFCSSSRSKRGLGVNLKHAEGLEVLHRLVALSDVVIENNSTGTMESMGVGYAKLKQLNPRIVMASSQLLGSRGAWADWIGYGPSTQPIGGLVHLWNYTDQDFPAGSAAIFPDHLAGRLLAVATLAALLRRERTGEGGHVEVAQVETVTGVLGDLLLKAGLEPGSVAPRGNRNERGAPWGAYPCAGEDTWCVISVRDDADWRALRAALGDPPWARASELETAAGRFAAQDQLDAELTKWTGALPKAEVAARLQAAGVPAGAVFTAQDQLEDAHFQERGYLRTIEQPALGKITLEGECFHASGMTQSIVAPAPGLGEHTRAVCTELLGMQDAEVDRLIAEGALEGPLES